MELSNEAKAALESIADSVQSGARTVLYLHMFDASVTMELFDRGLILWDIYGRITTTYEADEMISAILNERYHPIFRSEWNRLFAEIL